MSDSLSKNGYITINNYFQVKHSQNKTNPNLFVLEVEKELAKQEKEFLENQLKISNEQPKIIEKEEIIIENKSSLDALTKDVLGDHTINNNDSTKNNWW